MLLAYFNKDQKLTTIKSYKKILSLGSSLNKKNYLSETAINNTCLAIEKMKEKAIHYRPFFYVVATHAVRISKNKQELLDKIYKTTKLPVRVISGEEEARLIGLAISHNFPLKNKEILGLDIGGGSTEVTIYRNRRPLYVKSLKLGSVTLTSTFLKSKTKTITNEHIVELEKNVLKILRPVIKDLESFSFRKAVICSGVGKTLAYMDYLTKTNTKLKNPDKYVLNKRCLKDFYDKLCHIKQAPKIKLKWKISTNRSEIILAGLLIIYTLTRELKIPSWVISNFGIREGMILDTVTKKNMAPTNKR